MTSRYERLNDTHYTVFLIDSVVSEDSEGGYQIESGLAYLEPGITSPVALTGRDGEAVGKIYFPAAVVRRIKLALVAVNTIFKFHPGEN